VQSTAESFVTTRPLPLMVNGIGACGVGSGGGVGVAVEPESSAAGAGAGGSVFELLQATRTIDRDTDMDAKIERRMRGSPGGAVCKSSAARKTPAIRDRRRRAALPRADAGAARNARRCGHRYVTALRERERTPAQAGSTGTMNRRGFALALLTSIAAVACGGPPGPAAPPGPSRLELRAGDDRLVLDGSVKAVRDVPDPERPGKALAVDLADDARSRLTAFTARHVGERVRFVVAGREVMAPTVRDPITTPSILLTGGNDAEVDSMRRALAE
jgi:hypothetical protein